MCLQLTSLGCGMQLATRWERAMWRVRMDAGMDAFSFGGGECAEGITDALDESIEV